MGALFQLGAHTQDNGTTPLCMRYYSYPDITGWALLIAFARLMDNFQSTRVKARRNTEPSPKLLQHQERWWTSAQSTTLGLPPGPTTNKTLVNYANNIPTLSTYVNMKTY